MTLPDDQRDNAGQSTQDADQSQQDSGQQQGADEGRQQQAAAQQGAEQAGSAGASAGEGRADGGQSPWALLDALLSNEQGQQVFGLAATAYQESVADGNRGSEATQAAASAQSGATVSDSQRADLERRADEGDADAALELRKLDREQRAAEEARDRMRREALGEGLKEFIATPRIEALDRPAKLELAGIYMTQGPKAALERAFDLTGGNGNGNGNAGDAEQQAARARQNAETAASATRSATPNLPGAQDAGGAPPIPQGASPESVFNDYFAWSDNKQ